MNKSLICFLFLGFLNCFSANLFAQKYEIGVIGYQYQPHKVHMLSSGVLSGVRVGAGLNKNVDIYLSYATYSGIKVDADSRYNKIGEQYKINFTQDQLDHNINGRFISLETAYKFKNIVSTGLHPYVSTGFAHQRIENPDQIKNYNHTTFLNTGTGLKYIYKYFYLGVGGNVLYSFDQKRVDWMTGLSVGTIF